MNLLSPIPTNSCTFLQAISINAFNENLKYLIIFVNTIFKSLSMLMKIHQRIGHWKNLGLAWLIFLAIFVIYWLQLIASHQNHLDEAELQAKLDRKSTRLNSSHVRISYA